MEGVLRRLPVAKETSKGRGVTSCPFRVQAILSMTVPVPGAAGAFAAALATAAAEEPMSSLSWSLLVAVSGPSEASLAEVDTTGVRMGADEPTLAMLIAILLFVKSVLPFNAAFMDPQADAALKEKLTSP